MSIFKANDVRGFYPGEWDKNTVYKIAIALGNIFEGNKIVVGRDGRSTSDEIFYYLSKGLLECGMELSDLGVVDTPAVYFAAGYYEYDGGVMITASHNPPDYNGLKLIGRNVVPFVYETHIKRIEDLVENLESGNSFKAKQRSKKGFLKKFNIKDEYLSFLEKFRVDYSGIKVIFDCSNGSAGRFARYILGTMPVDTILINNRIDGSFPAHGPNPLAKGGLDQLREQVMKTGADVGFCFDGDGDRIVVVDDKSSIVSPDLITALLGEYLMGSEEETSPDTKVLVDIRSSNSVGEYLEESGAVPIQCPVGHAKIKKMLRNEKAVCAGELTGHYYYRDNFYCDSAWITAFIILNILKRTGEKLSVLSSRIMKYNFSGELSFSVGTQEKQDRIILKLLKIYSDAEIVNLDGYRFNYPDWWFIIRKSGTEPLLRLVVEAETKESLDEKVNTLSIEISR